jgi:hypothetical protein
VLEGGLVKPYPRELSGADKATGTDTGFPMEGRREPLRDEHMG